MTLFDRLMGREPAKKAVYGGVLQAVYANDVPLSVSNSQPQARMAAYLRAYKVGWFYKAGHKIAGDIAGLERTLSFEDDEGDNADEIVVPPLMIPWEQLDPLEQFLRLMERPNPYQTGRTLFTKTQIRNDFAGEAYWYLENGEGGQLPTGLYGISPTRMWPSLNAQGQLIGWVMDKDKIDGGVPFTVDEILPFIVPGSDEDIWAGQGVVEAVYANVPLSEQIARHTSNVLTTGGRLAGMIWPKERSLDEDEYLDAQRAWRNVASDPNAAKRMLIFPEPMEYAAGASTPVEIGIPELANLSRDEVLTAFPISPYQLGVPMPGGLNSGETRKQDRRDYYEGSIHPRVELLEETIQWGLIPRYEAAIGRSLDFDIEEPNLDDAPSIIEKVGALKGLISVGFDPKESISAVGLDHIQWTTLPALLDPAHQAMMAEQAAAQPADGGMTVTAGDTNRRDNAQTTQQVAGKAKMTRDDTIDREFPGLQLAVQSFLAGQQTRLIANMTATFPGSKKAWDDWWNKDAEDKAFMDHLRGIYLALGRDALQVVVENTNRILSGKKAVSVLDDMLERAGVRISDINETTRKAIADTLSEGTRRGYQLNQLIAGVPKEDFGGVHGALLDNGVNVWDKYRAEVIARTETMNAYNTAALVGYKEVNVRSVVALDGDKDDECATRDGETFTVDDALNITDHPNGTLDWSPTGDKSVDIDQMDRMIDLAMKAIDRPQPEIHMPDIHITQPDIHIASPDITITPPEYGADQAEAWKAISMMATRDPVVNVYPPDITVTTPDVHVTTPDVHVTTPPVTVHPAEVIVHPADVNITMPSERRGTERVERDKDGRITGITHVSRSIERDADGRITGFTED